MTDREFAVFQLLGQGKTPKEVARQLLRFLIRGHSLTEMRMCVFIKPWSQPDCKRHLCLTPAPPVAQSQFGDVTQFSIKTLIHEIDIKIMCRFLATTTGAGAILLLAACVPAQNLFVADWYSFNVFDYTPAGAPSTFASQMYGPVALAFDSSDNLYVGTMDGGGIIKVTPSGSKSTLDATGATSLAFNGAGNLFASDYGGGNIYEYTPNGTRTTFASGFLAPYGIAFNRAGDLFVADSYGENITEIQPNGLESRFATGLSGLQDLAFDPAGNLFATCVGTGSVDEFTPGGIQSTFASGLIHPYGLAFDSAGDLYVSDNGNGTFDSGMIYEFTPSGERSTFASGLGYGMPSGLAIEPVPEPSICGVMGVGALSLLYRYRRHI